MRRSFWGLLVACSIPAFGQNVITTAAGTTFLFDGNNKPALNATLGSLRAVAMSPSGDLLFVDHENHIVGKIAPSGTLTVVAGNGVPAFSGDGGSAIDAALSSPEAVAVDQAGNVYIADTGNRRIRKVTPDGVIQTISILPVLGASTGPCPIESGGAFASGLIIGGLAVDAGGNVYYGTDSENTGQRLAVVCKVAPDGTVSRVAGLGSVMGDLNGALATDSTLMHAGLAIDPSGNLNIADVTEVVRLGSDGRLHRVAGCYLPAYSLVVCPPLPDNTPLRGSLFTADNIAFDPQGNLLIIDLGSDVLSPLVYKLTPSGTVSVIAGTGKQGFSGDKGPATKAQLSAPFGIVADSSGDIYIAQAGTATSSVIITGAGRVRKITPDGNIDTIAGNGLFLASGDGGPAVNATIDNPWGGIAVDRLNNIYFGDSGNNKIRKIDSHGIISTVAGTGTAGFSGDGGPALQAQLDFPTGIAVDPSGNIFFADTLNNKLRKIAANGTITTIATGQVKFVAADAAGNVYFNGGGLVQTMRITPVGTTSAVTAFPANPGPMATDSAGNLYIAMPTGQQTVILELKSDGTSRTVANFNAGGTVAALALDPQGNIFAGFQTGVFRIAVDGTTARIAGNGTYGFSGDGGPATSASINTLGATVSGLGLDSAGNLYLTDNANLRIREVLAAIPQVVATPSSLQFTASSAGNLPPVQNLNFTGAVPSLGFSAQTASNWLHVSPVTGVTPRLLTVTADPTNLDPGTYTDNVVITAANGVPAVTSIPVTFTVTAVQPPQLSVDRQSLSFPFPKDGTPRSQPVMVSNAGGGTLPFTASASTSTGGNWLSVSPASGQALPSAPLTLTVTADPTGIPPGTYSGSLTISAGASQQTLPVVMTISSVDQAILLSQTGLSFLGVSQGGIVAPQTFGVINIGAGVVHWTVSKSTLSGGSGWLQIATADGSSTGTTDAAAATVPVVTVSVDPSMLPAGKYYGQVRVDSMDAANAPQVLTVFLQVLPAGSDIGAAAQPSEVLFSAQAGAGSPGSQDLLLYNIAAAPKSFQLSAAADPGLTIVSLPAAGTLNPQQPNRVVVQPLTDGLAPGVYNAAVTLQFSDGRVRSLKVTVAVAATASSRGLSARRDASAACSPTQLLPALTTLGQSFAVSAGWPVALGVDVQDDCGTPVDAGSVIVSFSNGDPPLSLTDVKTGHWETTWMTTSNTSQVTLKLQAKDAQGALSGERQVSGSLQAQTDPPVFDKPGIVSTASGQAFVPVAPGSIVTIYGDRLAQTGQAAGSVPLPTAILSTSVLIGGQFAPLYFVSQNQVNVQVPIGLNVNTTQQILVQQGETYSQPVAVEVAAAQPAAFLSGSSVIAFAYRGAAAPFLVSPGAPAQAGDVLVIYCGGLGVTGVPVVSGAVSPSSPLAQTAAPVTVQIGGVNVPVSFAGLAPGFVGLYQINATMPSGVPTGAAVPITISVAGQTSPSAVISVQ